MDPEQIYKEVLSEEQQKGSAPPVAEARAKAARQRAIEGSPHPKEPKWWPGSQPHFEGGGAPAEEAAPEEAAEEEAAPAAEAETAPAAEAETAPAGERVAAEAATQPEAQAPEQREIAQGAAPVSVTESPSGAATAETEQPAQPAAAATAAPAADATPTQLPPEQRPSGVTHGTTTGTRLRPEDAVATDVQFDAQRAMYDRRKLIDELVATGVPTVTAADTGRSRAPLLALLYLLIPILAVMFLVSQDEGSESAASEDSVATAPDNGGEGGVTSTVTAEGSAFDTDTITLAADEETSLEFVNNDDGVPHNIAIYEDDSADQDLFIGEQTNGGTLTYDIPAIPAGEYFFQCDFHPPSMQGTVVVE